MLTPRRSGRALSFIGPASAPRALDRVDHRRRAERGDDVGQVFHVLDLDIDEDLEEIDRAVGYLEIGNITGLLADDRRQAPQAAGLVPERNVDAAHMAAFAVALAVPGDIEPALGRV